MDNELEQKGEGVQYIRLGYTELNPMTRLYDSRIFLRRADELLSKADKSNYVMLAMDFVHFRLYNKIYGREEGDKVLVNTAKILKDIQDKYAGVAGYFGADNFCIVVPDDEKIFKEIEDAVKGCFEVNNRAVCFYPVFGVCAKEGDVSAAVMYDHATIALSKAIGTFRNRICRYDSSMEEKLEEELELLVEIQDALDRDEFTFFAQPQCDISTGKIVGAESLVRWIHGEKGMISPGVFIPALEKNGLISELDRHVWKKVCQWLRSWIDRGYHPVPISVNVSRMDIFAMDVPKYLKELLEEFDLPAKLLKIEITEGAYAEHAVDINKTVKELRDLGFLVMMDDFGSGYSSLNVLKDIELDIIKLDMLFMSQDTESKRGGTILSSIVRMAKWLGMPVIAEGVENVEQADFLRSIGCDCIQGYLYSKPLSEEEYEKILRGATIGIDVIQMEMLDILNANDFWDPKSQETLIFSNYVGAAAIYDYRDGQLEILRVNPKCLQELGNKLTEKDLIESNPWTFFDDENRKTYEDMIKRAIETGEEQECDTWQDIVSSEFGTERFCIHTNIYMIGKSEDACLFYAMIRNVTTEKLQMLEVADNERRFKMMSEQMNIYFWDYDVRTREMRPCFRCIRDLGFPEKFENYPESAIEMGIFPQEVAELYREWHIQIANGVKELEAVIPMTKDCVPFRIRYTTEFDEAGMPIKAYASAAPMEE